MCFDISRLAVPEIDFWAAWDGDQLLGVGAMKPLDTTQGEVKSMHTAASGPAARCGLARFSATSSRAARARGLTRLSLETGAFAYFAGLRWHYYKAHGFVGIPPFGDYRNDPNSLFLTLETVSRGTAAFPYDVEPGQDDEEGEDGGQAALLALPRRRPAKLPARPPSTPPTMKNPAIRQSTRPGDGIVRGRCRAEDGNRHQRRADRKGKRHASGEHQPWNDEKSPPLPKKPDNAPTAKADEQQQRQELARRV